MKIYNTQEEINKDIINGVLKYDGDIKITFNCIIDGDINARNIDAVNINARDINAWDINAWYINARNINAGNINAWDINARNINAGNINAGDIKYYAFCISYNDIKCKSIKGRRGKHADPICLDGELIIKEKNKEEEIITLNGKKYKLI